MICQENEPTIYSPNIDNSTLSREEVCECCEYFKADKNFMNFSLLLLALSRQRREKGSRKSKKYLVPCGKIFCSPTRKTFIAVFNFFSAAKAQRARANSFSFSFVASSVVSTRCSKGSLMRISERLRREFHRSDFCVSK